MASVMTVLAVIVAGTVTGGAESDDVGIGRFALRGRRSKDGVYRVTHLPQQ